MEINIDWHGPYKLIEIFEESFSGNRNNIYDLVRKGGVYIHTDRRFIKETGEHVAYVGKSAGNSFGRQVQHYKNIVGLINVIPRKGSLGPKVYSFDPGKPQHQLSVIKFDKFIENAKEAFDYQQEVDVYIGIPDKGNNNIIKFVEKKLLYCLKPCDTNWGTKTDPGDEHSLIQNGSLPNGIRKKIEACICKVE